MKRIITSFTSFLVMNAVIIYLALAKLEGQSGKYLSGYIAHFGAFFLLTFFFADTLTHRFVDYRHPFFLAIQYSLFFAILIEFLQAGTGYRTFSILDIVFSGIGAMSCGLIFSKTCRTKVIHKIFYGRE